MKFCTNCGQQLEEGQKFCTKCGKSLMLQNTNVQAPRKPIALGIKILIVSVLSIILGGGTAYGIGSYFTSEAQIVKNIEKAISSSDAKSLAQYLYSTEKDMKINEVSAAALIKFINEESSYKEDLIKSLKEGRSYDSFSMIENGRSLLVFKKYMLELEPQYLKLSSNYEGVNIKLNGQTIGKSLKDGSVKKFGPFMPGKYKLEFTFENEFGASMLEEEVKFEDGEFSFYAEFDLTILSVASYVKGLKLSVDGRETKTEINGNYTEIGPLPKGKRSILVFSKAYPWGKLESIEYNSNDMYSSNYIESFKMKDSDFAKSVVTDIKSFVQSYYAAKSTVDKEKLVNASEDCKNQFAKNHYWATAANYAFKKAYMDVEPLRVETDSYNGRDLFTVYVGSDYSYEGYDYNDSFTLSLYYDDINKRWIVSGYSTYGNLSGDLIYLQ